MKQPAVVLLSGGLDSSTCLALAKEAGFSTYAMTFAYGQRQDIELHAAQQMARHFGCSEHRVVRIDLRAFGGSALTADLPVPKDWGVETPRETQKDVVLPVTYVPARNTIFLSYALAWAEVIGAKHIFIGVNAVDYSGYPDCRPAFVEAFTRLANLATRVAVDNGVPYRIEAPLLRLTKAQIIREGVRLGVPYGQTHSCYDPVGHWACGACEACTLRRRGFLEAHIEDPTRYVLEDRDANGTGSAQR